MLNMKGLTYIKKNHSRDVGYLVALWLVTLVLVALTGISLALGIYPFVILLLVLLVGLALVAYPVVGVWVVIIGSLVGSGLIELYMPSLKPLVWALALLSMGIAGIALIKVLLGQNIRLNANGEKSSLVIWAFVFIICAIFSSLANWHGFSGLLVGLKGYFQIWGLLIGIYYLTKSEVDAYRLISFFLLLGAIQHPFVLHQILVLVPQRSGELFAAHGIVAGDIVAGTFGGSLMGGGRSPSLALLCVISITLVLARCIAGQYSARKSTLTTLYLMLPMFVSEAKIFLILLPIALFLLFQNRILANPLKALVGALVMVALLVAIFFAYSFLPGAKSQKVLSIQEMLNQNIEYNVGKRGYGNADLNRSTVYTFWIKEHSRISMLIPALIGHGPGATSGGTALNDNSLATKRYQRYGIGLTGLSSLLWEVGLLGTLAVLAIFVSAYRHAGRLVEHWRDTVHWSALKASQISIPLFAVSLLHNNYFVFDISFQTMLIVVLGYLITMTRFNKVS